jgi:hypothetical protein
VNSLTFLRANAQYFKVSVSRSDEIQRANAKKGELDALIVTAIGAAEGGIIDWIRSAAQVKENSEQTDCL